MGFRLFIFEDDGALRYIPQRVSNGLAIGRSVLPEYSGKKLKYALIFLATDKRRPVAITNIETAYFSFDERGNARPELARGAIDALETGQRLDEEKRQVGRVVSITARIKRRSWERENRWSPTQADIDRIYNAVFPKSNRSSV